MNERRVGDMTAPPSSGQEYHISQGGNKNAFGLEVRNA